MLSFSRRTWPRNPLSAGVCPALRSVGGALVGGFSLASLLPAGRAGAAEAAAPASSLFAAAPFCTETMLGFGLAGGIAAIALIAGYGLFVSAQRARKALRAAEDEISRFRHRLNTMQTVLNTQPQVVVETAPQAEPRVLFHSLQKYGEIPATPRELLEFPRWIGEGATELSRHYLTLLQRGQSFSMNVRTIKGRLLEVEGQTAGDALIVFRDLSQSLRKEVKLLDEMDALGNRIRLMQTLLDALPMPVWLRDREHRLDWVNETYLRAVDVDDRNDVYAKQIELLEQRHLATVNQELAKSGKFRQRLYTIVGGERQSFDTIAVDTGSGRAGIGIDVAAEESAQGTLDRHIAAHIRTLDRVNAAIAVFDADQRLSFHNKAYRDLWGLDEDWLNGRPKDAEILDRLRALRLLPEQADYNKWKSDWLALYSTSQTNEDKWYLPDGRAVHVTSDQSPDGGVIYVYDNLTESMDLQSSFNAALNVQRETLDALREGVAVFAPSGRMKLSNPAFKRIWSLNDSDLADEPHIEQVIHLCRPLYDSDDDWDAFRRAVTAIDEERQPFEGRFQRNDGAVLHFASFPLPDGATLLTFVDITDEERAERALLEKNKALEAADQLKNDFISNISYELRTPLTSIMGFGELMGSPMMGELNGRQQEYLANIMASSEKLEAIISNILDLVTIDAGTFELKLETVKISEILKAATLGVREKLKKGELHIDVDVKGNLDCMLADGQRVTQVLYNLLQNAIGFSDPGKEIRLRAAQQGPMIAFSVEDQGCGIPEDIRETVFNRFESRSQGSKHRGVGLGLSIVKSIVELHGGDIELLSKEGVGTKITVRFPKDGKPHIESAAE